MVNGILLQGLLSSVERLWIEDGSIVPTNRNPTALSILFSFFQFSG